MPDRRTKRDLHALNEDGMVLCNPMETFLQPFEIAMLFSRIKKKTNQFWIIMLAAILMVGVGCDQSVSQEKAAEQSSQIEPQANENHAQEGHSGGHNNPAIYNADGTPKFTNALAKETSPYLLLHAHNPVNWYPWNEESLALAKKEDKPIFLSIGYSSCHWCHVMERESFLDPEIAQFLNDNFVCIKVDREERPDVDEIYMESLMTWNRITQNRRGGGWPLSMFLTPEGKPFFGGTYFPARTGDRGATVGFFTIVQKIKQFWNKNRENVTKDANLITKLTKETLEGRQANPDAQLDPNWILKTFETLQEDFDPKYGGFRFRPDNPNIPKFPQPSNLIFLRNQSDSNSENLLAAKDMLVKTCERMMMGGIYDHVGGGFHRYSVDRYWKIPHYEKMLYDNGQLASLYSQVYELTGREEFKHVVEGILKFVDAELTSPKGGFYSALDAESEGEEGKFYVWSLEELKSSLSAEEFELFASVYAVNEGPNFEGKYYSPQLTVPRADHAKRLGITEAEMETKLAPIRKKLFDVRAKRERPLLDNKILTAWNGMMIRGYADAGRLLKNEKYIATAAKAADFVIENLTDGDGRLFRTYTNGEARLNAYLIDYACFVDGLIALHEATGDAKWVELADKFQQKLDELFLDEKNGGYFYTSKDHEVLLVRSKKALDNVIPAGNSMSASNLLYLSKQLKKDAYRERAKKAVLSAAAYLNELPLAAPQLLVTAEELLER